MFNGFVIFKLLINCFFYGKKRLEEDLKPL